MNLTQLNTVKARLGIDQTDVADDAILAIAIAALSLRVSNACNRQFARQSGATFVFPADEREIRVDRYPIEQVALFELKDSEAAGWVAPSPAPDYLISSARSLVTLSGAIGNRAQLARVTYDGGYVLPGTAPGSGQTALPDDLEQAVVEQI